METTKTNEIQTRNLLKLMYNIEALIKAEHKPFDVFIKEYLKLKRSYKAKINSK